MIFPSCRDFDTADKVLPTVPKEQRTRVAHFLEKQGFRKQALAVSSDPEHKFDLAIQLGDLDTAYSLAKESGSEQKWKQLAELATSQAKFELAQQCLHEAQDHGGLLLLATAAGPIFSSSDPSISLDLSRSLLVSPGLSWSL